MKKKNLASRLKKRITFQESVQAPDDLGGFITSWHSVVTVWAEIVAKTGDEKLRAEKIESANIYKITIRYTPSINSKMRIRYGTRTMNILSVAIAGDFSEMVEIIAEEVI